MKHFNRIYSDKSKCCGCGACQSICGVGAISMVQDELGFVFPEIDKSKCINCDQCKQNCEFQKNVIEPENICNLKVYAAISKNTDPEKSSSGGAFASMATTIIKRGGIVYGAAIYKKENEFEVKHIAVDKEENLNKLLGSKYIQSNTNDVFKQIEKYLKDRKEVLFSGTPCQCKGLTGYLRRTYENLYLVELICHGVPSQKMFNDYIKTLENSIKGDIVQFTFRDKKYGNSLIAKIDYRNYKGEIRSKWIPYEVSSYYQSFIEGTPYRTSCYSCPFARKERASDVTIGDFWGVEREHPELVDNSKGFGDIRTGCSVILINNERGKSLFEICKSNLSIYDTSIDKVVKNNFQLIQPAVEGRNREEFINQYMRDGYRGFENEWQIKNKKKIIITNIKLKLKKLRFHLRKVKKLYA
ncbi:MAG: Coenzyme F420 hydrogenase/dehydrogenase, beta subunit C-terminal domain [Suipraeoptans sp.]